MGIYKRGRKWQARMSVNGAIVRKSLETENEAEAKKAFESMKLAVPTKTFSIVADEWILSKSGIKASSLKKLKSDRIVLGRFFDNHLIVAVDDILITSFTQQFSGANNTLRAQLSHLKEILELAYQRKYIYDVPVIELPERKKKVPKKLTKDQIQSLLSTAEKFEFMVLKPVVYLQLLTGMRIMEAAHIRWSDLEDDVIHIRAYNGWSTKSGHDRSPTMGPKLRSILMGYKSKLHYIPKLSETISSKRTTCYAPWAEDSLKRRMRELWVDAGIYEKGAPVSHALRHTFASNFIAGGGSLVDLQEILGHSEPSVTAIYLSGYTESKAKGSAAVEDRLL